MNPWNISHPADLFQGVWDLVGRMIEARKALISEEVFAEVERKDDRLSAWLRGYKSYADLHAENIQLAAKAILQKHRMLINATKNKNSADVFVIALAQINGCVVVTEEIAANSTKRPKIPDVCRDYKIESINFVELLRREGYSDRRRR